MSNKLCSEPKWLVLLNRYVSYIRDEGYVKGNFPRFEDYSLLARSLPFFVYDNEEFANQTCKTAFTTGSAVFFYKDFFEKLKEVDDICHARGTPEQANHVLFVLLHEIAHCLNNDVGIRLRSIKAPIPNIAQDIANNLTLVFDLGIKIDEKLMKEHLGFSFYGLTMDSFVEHGNQSSETIALDLLKQAVKKIQNNNQSQQQGPQKRGEIDEIVDEIVEHLTSSSGKANDVDNHVLDHNAVAEAAKNAGISDETLNKINLNPRSKEETVSIEEMNKLRAQNAGLEMDNIHSKLSESDQKSTAAGTSGGYYKRKVNLGDEGTIKWKTAINETFDPGNSQQTRYTEDVLIDEFYDNEAMFAGVNYNVTMNNGCAIFLIDTSGSMNRRFLAQLFTEALSSVDLSDPESGFEKILLFPADVDVKDMYWELTADNKEEVMEQILDFGGGGTDFTLPLKNALLVAEDLELVVHGIIFGTDLDAPPPNFDYIENAIESEKLPPVIFITDANQTKANNFEKKCDGYAVVYTYNDGLELDLEEINDQLDSALNSIKTSANSELSTFSYNSPMMAR